MEKNILIKSDKLNLKKIFILSWTVVFFITCIALVTTIKQYSDYKKCQNIIVNTLIASDSKFEKYDNNKEKIRAMYSYLNPNYYSFKVGNETVSNSEAMNLARDVDIKLGDMLRKAGIGDAYKGSEYLLCHSFINYVFKLNRMPTVISLFMLIIIFLLNIWYMKEKTKEIIVTENSVFINKRNQELVLPIEKIHSIDVLFMNCLSFFVEGKKQKVYFLKNAQDIKHILTEKMLQKEI